jgi:hypothetical protein
VGGGLIGCVGLYNTRKIVLILYVGVGNCFKFEALFIDFGPISLSALLYRGL